MFLGAACFEFWPVAWALERAWQRLLSVPIINNRESKTFCSGFQTGNWSLPDRPYRYQFGQRWIVRAGISRLLVICWGVWLERFKLSFQSEYSKLSERTQNPLADSKRQKLECPTECQTRISKARDPNKGLVWLSITSYHYGLFTEKFCSQITNTQWTLEQRLEKNVTVFRLNS